MLYRASVNCNSLHKYASGAHRQYCNVPCPEIHSSKYLHLTTHRTHTYKSTVTMFTLHKNPVNYQLLLCNQL